MLQCLALVGAGFLQIGVGTELICSTVIIGALSENANTNERLTMTNEQKSWFGEYKYTYKHLFTTSLTAPISSPGRIQFTWCSPRLFFLSQTDNFIRG